MDRDIVIRRISAAEALPIRRQVLWPDQPLSYSMVEEDDAGWHFGAYDGAALVCVASVFMDGSSARLRKFATLPEYRNRGIGSAVLTEIVQALRAAGVERFWCDARLAAASLYRRFGMEEEGARFFKGEIPYARMSVDLSRR